MVLPSSSSVGGSQVVSSPPSLFASGWAPPIVPSLGIHSMSGLISNRNPTPIPPKRSFQLLHNFSEQPRISGLTLPPHSTSPLALLTARRLRANSSYGIPDSATHKLRVPNVTPATVQSPYCSPLLTVRNCLPMASSPMSEARALPVVPPSSPAVSVTDKLTRSAVFNQLIQERATQAGDNERRQRHHRTQLQQREATQPQQ